MKTIITALTLALSPMAYADQVFDIDCQPIELVNGATITGQLTVHESAEEGQAIASGVLNLVLKKAGPTPATEVTGLSIRGEFLTDVSEDAQGEPTPIRVINVVQPGQGVDYIRLSLDLQRQSWVRMSDLTRYHANCVVTALE